MDIPENVPFGTPLANLDMEVKDTDTGPNALFKVKNPSYFHIRYKK